MGKSVLQPSIAAYRVGEDISPEDYNELVLRLGDWFAVSRKTKEPVALAKQVVECCLKGIKPKDGSPWQAAATSTLAKRLAMAAQFDLETMTPMKSASQTMRERKERNRERKAKKQAELAVDTNYPEEYSAAEIEEATYGDDPRVFFTTKERETYERKRTGILKKFPQLDNIAQEAKVAMYVTLTVLFERAQFRTIAAGTKKNEIKATEREMTELTKQLVDLEKAMGIDPVTISKTQDKKEGGSIGEAIRRFEAMPDYREVRAKLWAEELIMLYAMYMQPSPRTDMQGYQLDEVGLYGLTKTRLIECPHCGEKNWAGFKIEEIEAWLISNGHLKPVEGIEPGDYLVTPLDSNTLVDAVG